MLNEIHLGNTNHVQDVLEDEKGFYNKSARKKDSTTFNHSSGLYIASSACLYPSKHFIVISG